MKSKTWGEVRSLLSGEQLEEVQQMLDLQGIDFDTFHARQCRRNPRLSRKKALEAYRALPPEERLPLDEEPFRPPGAFWDYDWPGRPAQMMLAWMPRDLPGASVEASRLSGSFLCLEPADEAEEAEIVKAVEAAGYRCVEDHDLVNRACGY
jgi:hypothetical protein